MARLILNNLGDDIADSDDDAQNIALGRFMTAWSDVEDICGHLFRTLADMNTELSSIIFDNVGKKEQIKIVTALIDEFVVPDEREEATAAMNEVQALSEKRNKIAHARWGIYNDEKARFWHSLTSAHFGEIQDETPKGNALRQKNIHTISDLDAVTQRCVLASKRLVIAQQNAAQRRNDARMEKFLARRAEIEEQMRALRENSEPKDGEAPPHQSAPE